MLISGGSRATVKNLALLETRLDILYYSTGWSGYTNICLTFTSEKNIDRLYVLEYSIGEKSGRVHKVLKEWDL
jgi:hypothetical protein